MKRLLFASTAIAFAMGSATAADMRVKAPIASPPPVYSWTGVYFGGFVGGLWSKTDNAFVFPPPGTIAQSSSQGFGGGFGGAQAQFQNLVIGVEAGVGAPFTTNFGSGTCNPLAACSAGFTMTETVKDRITTVGGRVGLAWDRWMLYASGGFADAPFTQAICGPVVCPAQVATGEHRGGYYGGGIDVMVYGSWIAGFEYRHYQFDTQTVVPFLFPTGGPVVANTITSRLRLDTAVFR